MSFGLGRFGASGGRFGDICSLRANNSRWPLPPWPFAMQRRMKRAKKGGWQYFNYRQRANIAVRKDRTNTASCVRGS
jgi:hypothetical protein